MTSMMRLATRNLGLTLAAVLSMALATAAHAAAEVPATTSTPSPAATQQPAQELEQLDEIWVHGKSLARATADAEDDFFKLYNKLNKDDDYDVECGYMSLDRGSMIMNRVCVPTFLAEYNDNRGVSAWGGGRSFDSWRGRGGCNMVAVRTGDMPGDTYYTAGDCAQDFLGQTFNTGYKGTGYFPTAASGPLYSPLPQLLAIERRKSYADNVMKVIYSDPVLLRKAEHLAGLYNEMKSVQRRYVEARAADPNWKSARPNLGPRKL